MESGHTNFQGPSLGNGHYVFATKRLLSNAPLNVSQFIPLTSSHAYFVFVNMVSMSGINCQSINQSIYFQNSF